LIEWKGTKGRSGRRNFDQRERSVDQPSRIRIQFTSSRIWIIINDESWGISLERSVGQEERNVDRSRRTVDQEGRSERWIFENISVKER
jgi:hypothetical protein